MLSIGTKSRTYEAYRSSACKMILTTTTTTTTTITNENNNDSSTSMSRIMESRRGDRIVVLLLRRFGMMPEKQQQQYDKICHSLQTNACRLCICCDQCPCETNPYYFVYLFVAVSAGILLLWWISTSSSSSPSSKKKMTKQAPPASSSSSSPTNNKTKKSANTTTSTTKPNDERQIQPQPQQSKKDSCVPTENSLPSSSHVPKNLFVFFSREQQSVVYRAVNVWEQQDIVSKEFADKLRGTIPITTTTKTTSSSDHEDVDNNNDKRKSPYYHPRRHSGSILASILTVLAFSIALMESSSSLGAETLLRQIIFGPWIWLVGGGGDNQAPIGKALAMLMLAILTHCYHCHRPSRRDEGAIIDSSGDGIAWEMTRVFFVMTYIGAVTYSVVDTGRHVGETTYGQMKGSGSDLWYATVGMFGSVAMVILGCLLPRHYYYRRVNTWVAMAMGLMLVQESYAYLSWLYGMSFAMLLLKGSAASSLSPSSSSLRLHFVVQSFQLETVGTVYLVIAAMIDEIIIHADDASPSWYTGAWLGFVSVAVLGFGAMCTCSEFQASAATVGACIAAFLANQEEGCWSFWGLNAFLRLAVLFTICTIALVVLGESSSSFLFGEFVVLPPKTRSGISIVLVVATLVLLLITIVVGNSHHGDEWLESMDLGNILLPESKQRGTDDAKDDSIYYVNRGIYMLPWVVPFVLYYTALCRWWPEMEKRVRPFHAIRVAVLLVCACHLLRTVSWSLLFLVLAGISVVLPRFETYIHGEQEQDNGDEQG